MKRKKKKGYNETSFSLSKCRPPTSRFFHLKVFCRHLEFRRNVKMSVCMSSTEDKMPCSHDFPKFIFLPLFANSNFENEFCRDSSFLEYFLQKERKNVDYLLFLLLIHFNYPLQQQQLIQIPSFKGNNPKSLWCGATSS